MKKPLAIRLKPKTINDLIGQKHLLKEDGIIHKCISSKQIFSMILYGPSGCGKTSIASVLANSLNIPFKSFNAAVDNKKQLDEYFMQSKLSDNIVLFIDEIHRLNKAKQDLLLPYIEDGSLIIIGATNANPFHSIVPAIRSRCILVEVKCLEHKDIIDGIEKALKHPDGLNNQYEITQEAQNYIASIANGDIRFAYNVLEIAAIMSNGLITIDIIKDNFQVNHHFYKDGDSFYDLLSCFQKSIRGSDVNASLYYLANLLKSGDLDAVIRRLLVIAYEDIGLANPNLISRTKNVCDISREIGLPEAIIPLGEHVIELALSSKSKTAYNATFKAWDIANNTTFKCPEYLKLTPIGLEKDEQYNYERKDCYHKIQYLPNELKDLNLIENFGLNKYEVALSKAYDELKNIKRTNNLKKLYKTN